VLRKYPSGRRSSSEHRQPIWLSGEPIERISFLCGRADKTTTKIYIKARWTETAASNLPISSSRSGGLAR
jgi:hypothetical protein